MADSTVTPEIAPTTGTETDTSKARFSRALDEAKAGAQQLGKEAQERADLYREKLTATGSELAGEAKARAEQAKDKASGLAVEGKAKASEALGTLARLVEDNVGIVDEKVGAKYGDYARSAAKGLNDAAARLEAKDLNELGEDVKQFVRTSPGLAIGIAAAGGFLLARLFKGSNN
jgi:hypothetical protein